MLDNLIKLYKKGGMSTAEATKIAEQAMGVGAILAKVKEDKVSRAILTGKETRSPLSQENGFTIQKSAEELNPAKPNPVFNPFAKKEN